MLVFISYGFCIFFALEVELTSTRKGLWGLKWMFKPGRLWNCEPCHGIHDFERRKIGELTHYCVVSTWTSAKFAIGVTQFHQNHKTMEVIKTSQKQIKNNNCALGWPTGWSLGTQGPRIIWLHMMQSHTYVLLHFFRWSWFPGFPYFFLQFIFRELYNLPGNCIAHHCSLRNLCLSMLNESDLAATLCDPLSGCLLLRTHKARLSAASGPRLVRLSAVSQTSACYPTILAYWYGQFLLFDGYCQDVSCLCNSHCFWVDALAFSKKDNVIGHDKRYPNNSM